MPNTSTRPTIPCPAALRRSRLALVMCAALAAVPCAALADEPAAPDPADASARLTALLERLDRSADVYRSHALEFGCVETIRWSGDGRTSTMARAGGSERFGYVVAHGDDDGFTDYRTRTERLADDDPKRRVTPDEFDVPRYLGSPYTWIFTFERSRWPHHTYEITGEESILGRPVVTLAFSPVPPIEPGVNDWYGTAWIDADTGQVRKVESYTPDDRGRLDAMQRHAASTGGEAQDYDVERITTWFDTRIDELRFPSLVEIRRINYHLRQGPRYWEIRPESVLQVDQRYDDYRFVRVDPPVEPRDAAEPETPR